MSKRRTERLLGLVVSCSLPALPDRGADPRRGAGYPEQDEAFKRMFERDKEELRDLGMPLETGAIHPFDDDLGYRIRRQDYELPEIQLEPDEVAVLGLASRVWQRAELAGAAAGALLKLRAAGMDGRGRRSRTGPQGIEPRLGTPEAAFGPLWEAVRDRRPVTFSYRAAGAERPAAARARAVGRGQLARPLVRGGLGPGAQRHPGVPARAGSRGR